MKLIFNRLLSLLQHTALLLSIAALGACGTSPPVADIQPRDVDLTASSIDELLSAARGNSGAEAVRLTIIAMEEMLQFDMLGRASGQAELINDLDGLSDEMQLRAVLIRAEIALRQDQADTALRWLTGSIGSQIETLFEYQPQLQQIYYAKLGDAYQGSNDYIEAASAYIELASKINSTSLLNQTPDSQPEQLAHDRVWAALSKLSDSLMEEFATTTNSYETRGWIELARVIRSEQFSIKSQMDSIDRWRRIWSQHPASSQLPSALMNLRQTWDNRPKHIALILPLKTPAGNAIHEGFLSAYYQALTISREVPRISVYDSSDALSIYSIYNEAVSTGADLIIGPLNKELVNQLQQLEEIPVQTLALNYADDSFTNSSKLMQFGLAPEDEILQAATLAWEAGHRNAAIITPQSDVYLRLQSTFNEIWTNLGGRLVAEATFSGENDYAEVIKRVMAIDSSESRADRLLALLPRNSIEFIPRRRNDIDFIFLIANPREGRQIKPTLAFYFAGNIPVYSLPSIYDGQPNQSADQDLDGIVFTDAPWVLNLTDELKLETSTNLRPAQGPLQRLRAMGVDSFRLYPRLQQLANSEIESLQGVTGKLSMNESGRIHRDLEVARFVNGLATVLEGDLNDSD